MSAPLPTVADMQAYLALLVEEGLGDEPVQTLVVPDRTIDAIARSIGTPFDSKPATMIEYPISAGRRLPVSVISADRLAAGAGR